MCFIPVAGPEDIEIPVTNYEAELLRRSLDSFIITITKILVNNRHTYMDHLMSCGGSVGGGFARPLHRPFRRVFGRNPRGI